MRLTTQVVCEYSRDLARFCMIGSARAHLSVRRVLSKATGSEQQPVSVRGNSEGLDICNSSKRTHLLVTSDVSDFGVLQTFVLAKVFPEHVLSAPEASIRKDGSLIWCDDESSNAQ